MFGKVRGAKENEQLLESVRPLGVNSFVISKE